jgi:hypothetical protein
VNNRKNYNSIVFLTVYFGLVLVGATPQVLAQAAMTRQFDIKTEIEFKDDLDKKPDENDLFTTSIVNLVRELNRFSEKKQFDWNGNTEYQIESLAICGSDNSPSFLGTNSGNHKIDRALKKTGRKQPGFHRYPTSPRLDRRTARRKRTISGEQRNEFTIFPK